ncbi:uncharacterized protein LOC128602725 isoform X1 [Ictalurus furcatus]|uniref:uncharacterized protein LOC128602725 isoform X1 n=1 Tax=Ictalurus furcatus TaxID=66913 RepID=UPI00235014E8|nr:uncharacterized protein LOC128602725 isoform X1 [Ictalurus furcatus]
MAKLSAAEKQRHYRQRRDADPERRKGYLQSRKQGYTRDVEMKKRKRVSELSEREKRAQRKAWRVRQQRHRAGLRAGAVTPPSSPDSNPSPNVSRQPQQGRRARRRDAQRNQREIEKLKDEVILWKRGYEKAKKRNIRLQHANLDSPEVKTQNILQEFRPNVLEHHHSGQWCVVRYDDEPYPGIILKVEENNVEVKCMHRNGVNKFFWPSPRDDINWYHDDQIMCLIPEPLALNRHSAEIDQRFWEIILRQQGK